MTDRPKGFRYFVLFVVVFVAIGGALDVLFHSVGVDGARVFAAVIAFATAFVVTMRQWGRKQQAYQAAVKKFGAEETKPAQPSGPPAGIEAVESRGGRLSPTKRLILMEDRSAEEDESVDLRAEGDHVVATLEAAPSEDAI